MSAETPSMRGPVIAFAVGAALSVVWAVVHIAAHHWLVASLYGGLALSFACIAALLRFTESLMRLVDDMEAVRNEC